MGAGRFVGRVGGLAVALGVGAAISLGSAVAWADEGPGAGSGSEESAAPDGPDAGGESGAGNVTSPMTDAGTETSEPVKTVEAEAKTTISRSGSVQNRRSATAKRERSEAAEIEISTRPARYADDTDRDDPAVQPKQEAAPVATAPLATAPALAAEVEPTAPVVAQADGVASAAFAAESPLLVGAPGGPLAYSPMSWVVAAAARREFGGGSAPLAKTASVVSAGEPLSGVTALAGAAPAAPANSNPVLTVTVGQPDATTGVATGQILATDVDNNKLKITAAATSGQVSINAKTGVFTYTPTAAARHAASLTTNPLTQDTIKVTVTDGKGGTAIQTVAVAIVASVNAVPTAPYSVGKPSASTGAVTVTVKGADKDKDPLAYSVTAAPSLGSVSVGAKGTLTYTPTVAAQLAAGAASTDSFTFTVSDGHGGSLTQTVTVPIAPNRAPTVTPPVGPKTNATTGVVTGTVKATDPDKNAVIYSTGPAAKGTVTINAKTGAFAFTPTQAARQAAATSSLPADTQDSFIVTATDSKGATVTQVVTVPITPNKAPVNPTAGVPVTNQSTAVVTGKVTATDPDGDALKYGVVSGKTGKGAVKITTAGAYTYTPTAAARHAAAAIGASAADTSDTFTVTITDAKGAVITQDVTVSLLGKNTAPTVTVTVGKPNTTDGTLTGTVKGTDKDKDLLTYGATATSAKGGTVSITAAGVFTYTPTVAARNTAAASGATAADKLDTLTVTVADGYTGGVITKTFTVPISPKAATPSNFAPIDGNYTVTGTNSSNGAVTGTLSATDPDDDALSFSGPPTTGKGTLTISGTTFTYTPTAAARLAASTPGAPAAAKTDTFTVTASDGNGGTLPFSVTVTITPISGTSTPTTVSLVGSTKLNWDVDGPVITVSPDGSRTIVTDSAGAQTKISVINTMTGHQVGAVMTIDGSNNGLSTTVFSADGSRATVTTTAYDSSMQPITRFVLINAVTGVQIGSTFSFAASTGTAQFNADGTRLLLSGLGYTVSGTTATYRSTAILLNASTGAQLMSTAPVAGLITAEFSSNGSRVALSSITMTGSGTSYSYASQVKFFNAGTGAQVGNTVSKTGYVSVGLNADGSRAVLNTVSITNAATGAGTTVITEVNTGTGSQIGSAITLSGYLTTTPAAFTADGSRAVVTAYRADATAGTYESGIVVINTATGAQVGSMATVTGIGVYGVNAPQSSSAQLNATGTRATLVTVAGSPANRDVHVLVVDTATGLQVGTATTLAGFRPANLTSSGITSRVTADGSQLVIVADSSTGGAVAVVSLATGGVVSARAVATSDDGENTTTIELLEFPSGTQIGSPVVVVGVPQDVTLSPDGTFAVITTQDYDDSGTRVIVINTATGAQIGSTAILDGWTSDRFTSVSSDGTRIVILTGTYDLSGVNVNTLKLT